MIFDDAPFLLTPLRENDESEKLVVKACCEFEHDTIVVSMDILLRRNVRLRRLIWKSLMLRSVLRSCPMI